MKEQQHNQKTAGDKEFDDWMRKFYNKKARLISEKGYQHARWQESPRKRQQLKFSRISLTHHLRNVSFKNCLEVGCGPGTWTKLLLQKYPGARFTCLDISKEMIAQFKQNVKSKKVKTVISSFLDYNTTEKYDFIFASRSIEYIPNKAQVIARMSSLLNPGGKAMIITSPPHKLVLGVKRAMGKKININHTRRISVPQIHHLLRQHGLVNIRFYPILFSDFFLVPTSTLFKTLYKKPWGVLSNMFASGYVVTFEKPRVLRSA